MRLLLSLDGFKLEILPGVGGAQIDSDGGLLGHLEGVFEMRIEVG